jgi:hypothetical protein
MIELPFLIIFPTIAAILLLFIANDTLRNTIVKISALVIGAGTLYVFFTYFN